MRGLAGCPVVKSPHVAISQKRAHAMCLEMRSNLRTRRIFLTVGYKDALGILGLSSGIAAFQTPVAPLSQKDPFRGNLMAYSFRSWLFFALMWNWGSVTPCYGLFASVSRLFPAKLSRY